MFTTIMITNHILLLTGITGHEVLYIVNTVACVILFTTGLLNSIIKIKYDYSTRTNLLSSIIITTSCIAILLINSIIYDRTSKSLPYIYLSLFFTILFLLHIILECKQLNEK